MLMVIEENYEAADTWAYQEKRLNFMYKDIRGNDVNVLVQPKDK